MWIVDGAGLLISPDTGPLHIGRALGTPSVALFGYTNPKRSGPWRAFEDLVVDGYAEYPGEDYPLMPVYRNGMSRIGVGDVMDKVARGHGAVRRPLTWSDRPTPISERLL